MPSFPRPSRLPTLALGVVAGVMSGLFGIGGGAVIVPGLVLAMGVQQHVAHATSLAAILVTAPAAVLPFVRDGSVQVAAALLLSAGALVGAWLGAGLVGRIPAAALRKAFAVLLVVVSVQLLLGEDVAPSDAAAGRSALGTIGLALLGLVAGALSAVMGVGGGVIMVPGLVVGFGLDQHTAEGTSLLVIIPTAALGAWRLTRQGYTDWRTGLSVGLGGVGGGLGGAVVALALPTAVLQRLFGVFLVITGMRLLGVRPPGRRARSGTG